MEFNKEEQVQKEILAPEEASPQVQEEVSELQEGVSAHNAANATGSVDTSGSEDTASEAAAANNIGSANIQPSDADEVRQVIERMQGIDPDSDLAKALQARVLMQLIVDGAFFSVEHDEMSSITRACRETLAEYNESNIGNTNVGDSEEKTEIQGGVGTEENCSCIEEGVNNVIIGGNENGTPQ